MITLMILFAAYVLGYVLSYLMLLTELKADGAKITFGDRALMIFLSLLSFVMVFYNLISAWIYRIGLTGYWDRPIKKEIKIEEK